MAKIMLVEDDNNLREIYGARLGAEGHTIVSAKDGEEALALAVKEKPDLIISDVMMPRISGFDMLDILRNAPETKNTKIIMMTALSQAEDKARADKLGADLYLVKSQVTLEDVAKAVDQVLSGGAQQSSDEPAPAEKPAETAASEPSAAAHATEPAPPASETVKEAAVSPENQPEGTSPPPPAETPQQSETPPSEPSTVASPAVETLPASTPKKIEITEASETPAAKTEEKTEEETPLATPVEVVLPDTPDEDKSQSPESEEAQPSQPTENPAVTPQVAPDSPTADEGPNLDEVLAEEAKAADGSEEETTAPAPAPVEPAAPPKEEAKPTESPETSPLDNGGTKKKVIEPINDINKKPDLEALLAKEEASEAVSTPAANTVVSPDNKPDQEPSANPSKPAGEPPKSPPDDFSKVAL